MKPRTPGSTAHDYLFTGGEVGRPAEELAAAHRRRREILERLGDEDVAALLDDAYAVALEGLERAVARRRAVRVEASPAAASESSEGEPAGGGFLPC